jgi:peptidoglycan/LPS O-acetylase OafA/YrhL
MEGRGATGGDSSGGGPRFYHPELDGLRMVAFLLVFVSHSQTHMPHSWAWTGPAAPVIVAFLKAGAYGVNLFFVLSAYLLVALLDREREATGSISVRMFLVRRTLRIWPLYFFFLGAIAAVQAAGMLEKRDGSGYFTAFATFTGNWAIVLSGAPGPTLTHLWSVCVEEQFYLFLPVLLKVVPRARWPLAFAAMAAVGFATRIEMTRRGLGYPATWCSTLVHLDDFAVGGLLACARSAPGWLRSGSARAAVGLAGLAVCVAVGGNWPLSQKEPRWETVFAYPAVAVGAGLMLVAALGAGNSFLASGPSRYLGRISYGLYVYHTTFIILLHERFGPGSPSWALVGRPAVALAATLAVSAVSYALLERPFLRWKERFSRVLSRPV